MKKVSIVIPTRNRAHLLRFALKSAVEQSYENLEIIVCDNYSQDNTKEVVDLFKNQNIVYVRTKESLAMPDNWEFALGNASGEYIAFLTDDSYFFPDAIKIAMSELDKFQAEVAVWKHCAYFASDWLDPARRNILYFPKVTFKSRWLDSKKSLQRLYDIDDRAFVIIPKSLNSLCHRSVIEKVINKQGRFFLNSCPDYASAASVMLNVKKYLLIDKPLYIDGVTTSSIGATSGFNLGESTQNFIKEFEEKIEDITFLGILTPAAGISKSLENVRKFYLDDCPKINIEKLLCAIADCLTRFDFNGVNTDNYRQIFNKYLSQQSMSVKLAVARQKFLSKPKWAIIKKIRSIPFLEYLETLRNMRILRGEDWKFNDIEECAKILVPMIKFKESRK
ncbi:MAG: glycosyltransferase family 2 protein [bacterium]